MTGWPVTPGVPAAGHISGNGFWHPGGLHSCSKTPCGPEPEFPVGSEVVYHPRPGLPGEDGVVTGLSGNPALVFVRYADQHPGAPGRATPVRMLTRTSGAHPRGG